MPVRSSSARPERLVLLLAALGVACGAEPSNARSSQAVLVQPSPPPDAGDRDDPGGPAEQDAALPEVPRGAAVLEIHVPRGSRQPLALTGTVESIGRVEDAGELAGWTEIVLRGSSAEPQRFYLLIRPEEIALPFSTGDRISVEIDCRKGGWHRVCDGSVRDAQRRTLMIVSGSGDERIAEGWKLERGAVATSEHHPASGKSIEHTHALVIAREGRKRELLPHLWHRFEVRGERWLVQGYEVVWEGLRPPDAQDHRAFSILRER